MAEFIRSQEELLAVRLSTEVSDGRLRLEAAAMRGSHDLDLRLNIPLKRLGYQMPVAGQSASANLGLIASKSEAKNRRLISFFQELSNLAEPDEAIWLQITYGAEILAAYPWEEVIGEYVDQPILRIPNFVRNAYRDDGEDPIIICAATPVAKGAPEWKRPLTRFLDGLNTHRKVFVYVKRGCKKTLRNLDRSSSLNVEIVEPSDAIDPTARAYDISDSRAITNPWLTWIVDDQRRRAQGRAHAVHFFCTGFSQHDRGAIALPESPLQDKDRRWSRFVGAPEFGAFADALEARITGFTACGRWRWKEGLRLFVNALSWERPGVVIGDFSKNDAALDAYHSVFSGYMAYSPDTHPICSVHPQTLFSEAPGTTLMRSVPQAGEIAQSDDDGIDIGQLQDLLGAVGRDLPAPLLKELDRLSSMQPKSLLRAARDRGILSAIEFLAGVSAGRR